MNKPIRWIVSLLAVLVVLSVALSAALLLLVDPNDYRDEISVAVTDATGRPFVIEGELSLKTFPCCGVELGALELGNPPGFPAAAFARVESAAVDLQLWPLLTSRELRVGDIKLTGLKLNLLGLADGTNNWVFAPADDAPQPSADTEATEVDLAALDIYGIEIADGELSFRDEATNQHLRLSDMSLSTGSIQSGEPFDVSSSLLAEDLISGTSASLELSTTAVIDTESLTADLADTRVEIALNGSDLPAAAIQLSAVTQSVSGLGSEQIVVTDQAVTVMLEGAADGTVDAVLKLSVADATISAAESVDINTIAASLELTGADLPGGKVAATSTLDALLGLGSARAELQGLVVGLQTANIGIALEGEGELIDNEPAIRGSLTVEPFSPAKLLETMGEPPIITSDPTVLQSFALRSAFDFSGDSAGLEKIDATLDDSRITGRIRADSLAQQRFQTALVVDAIDLDRYLMPTDDSDAATAGPGDSDDSLDLPVEELRALNLDGQLSIGQLKVADARLSKVFAKISASDGLLMLNPASAKLYDGSYMGNLKLDVRGEMPTLNLDQKLDNISLGGLLGDVSDVDNLAGRGNVRITAAAKGNSVNELLGNLTGTTSLELQKGQYTGVDVWYEIRKVRASLVNEPAPLAPENPATDITQFSGTAKFADGTMSNDDFAAQIPFMRLQGVGGVNLLQSSVDYKLNGKVVGTPVFADGQSLADLDGLTLPITIRGSMDAPTIGIDLKEFAASLAQGKLRDRLQKVLDIEDDPDESSDSQEPTQEKSSSDQRKEQLKKGLFDLLGN